VGNILDFPTAFPGATVVTLETNYRSTQPILDVTNRIIGLSPKRHAKELRSVKGNGPKPALITCEREEDQTDFVVAKVLEHNENGLGLRRQAILVRTAYWSDHLVVELTRRNIPYRKYGGLKFLEAAHIKEPVFNLGNQLQPNDLTNSLLFCCPYVALKISPGPDPLFKTKARLGPFMAQGRADF
jgi:DNA helicase II / ATP-dependent DNA helicase PcrA